MRVASFTLGGVGIVLTIYALVRLAQLRPNVTARQDYRGTAIPAALTRLQQYVEQQSIYALIAAIGATFSLAGLIFGWYAS